METPVIMKWEGWACGELWMFPGSQHNNDVYRTKLGHLFNGNQIVWRMPCLHQAGCLPRETLAGHESALAYTVKGGNAWCLWSEIWGENILCDLFLSVHNVGRRGDSLHLYPPPPITLSQCVHPCGDAIVMNKRTRNVHALASILSAIWSATTVMDFNEGADTLWNQSGWCETCWKEWWYCKNLVYFHLQRSIWEHVTKDEVVCMWWKGRRGRKDRIYFKQVGEK